MQRSTLGRSGIDVSRLGFGGLFVADFVTALDQAKATVAKALDLGITYIDTAPTYGNSEQALGAALAGERRPLVLSTKLGGRPQPFDPKDRAGLLRSLEESLRLLGRERIDLLMVHEPDRPRQYAWWTDMVEVRGPVLDLLDDLKRQGVIRAIGIGGTTVAELAHLCRSRRFDVVLTAFNASLLWREAFAEVMPAARAAGMGIIVGSPLQQGALARRYDAAMADPRVWWLPAARREQFRRLYALCDETGLPLSELALRWLYARQDVDCVLVGARTPDEIAANVAAVGRGPLDPALVARLDAIAALLPCRPFGEPFGLGWILGDPLAYPGQGQA